MSQFTIEFKENADTLFNRAFVEGQKYNAKIKGNSTGGSFEVTFLGSALKGNYNVSASTIKIIITGKPFFLSNKSIESAVKNFIG